MRKFFVLDTQVLRHEPHAVRHSGDPDGFKREGTERGGKARMLDELRRMHALSEGAPLDRGGRLRGAERATHVR